MATTTNQRPQARPNWKKDPATEAQLSFVSSLLDTVDRESADEAEPGMVEKIELVFAEGGVWSKGMASRAIEFLKKHQVQVELDYDRWYGPLVWNGREINVRPVRSKTGNLYFKDGSKNYLGQPPALLEMVLALHNEGV